MNPAFTTCPPLPSATQVQVLTIGTDSSFPANGQLVLNCGATLGSLNASSLLFDLQNQLSLNFPGSVAMGQAGSKGVAGKITVQFFTDPGAAITEVSNTLVDDTSEPVALTIAPNPGVLYPNYTYLTSRWTEFLLSNPTPDALQIAETQLMGLKLDAWAYVQPGPWGNKFVQATFLMVAHLKKLGKDPVGYVTEQSAKNLSESYADDKFLDGTVYGQQFKRLRDATILTMRFIPAGGGVGRIIGNQSGGFEGPHDGDYQPIN